MIFEKITIENLFSYHKEQEFNFPAPGEGKSIILISGRNGYGKTSFINCIKLLFLGVNDEILTKAQPGKKLRTPAYLLGLNREWQGIFNRKARQNSTEATRFGISIRWKEDQGTVTAHRYWTLVGADTPEHHLNISTDFETDFGKNITDAEYAEEFLERRLPKSIVPFFFYDGEQVTKIAEDNSEGQLRQMEKLLDIAAIDTLDEYLQKNISEWKKEGAIAEKTQSEITSQQAQRSVNLAALKALHAEHDDLTEEIAAIDRTIKKHERARDALRIQSLQRDEPKLKENLMEIKNDYEVACQEIADNLIPAAPLWASFMLITQVGERLTAATENRGHMLAEEVRSIIKEIQENIFDKPPHSSPILSPAQKKFYQSKIEKWCSIYTEMPTNGFYSLTSADTLNLKRSVDYYTQAHAEKNRRVEELRRASLLRRKLIDTEIKLDNLTEISPEEQKGFQERLRAIQTEQLKKDAVNQRIGAIKKEIQQTEDAGKNIAQLIKELETKLVKDSINTHRVERARQAQRLFSTYKSRLKETRRDQIESAVNDCFNLLMTSHKQISQIKVDNDFALSYLDSTGKDIGMANLSAGMKQLAAQALLWALSDVADRDIPVIVDTPLARIDRLHQENLLTNYYPKAGRQIIMLPTDSEIDKEKYRIIQPYISTEFTLDNSKSGDSTEIRANTKMYNLRTAS